MQKTKQEAQERLKKLQEEQKELQEIINAPEPVAPGLDTLEAIFEKVKPTEDQMLLLNYSGTDDKVLGAKNWMLAEMIAEAFGDGWVGDFSNDEPKWFPVFDGRRGFVFSHSFCDDWFTFSFVGSRHCFRTEQLSDAAAKRFPEVYRKILTKTSRNNEF